MDAKALPLRVYVVTSSGLAPGRGHAEVALAAIEGGASAVQLRAPELDDDDLLRLAARLVGPCREAGVLLVVNDRVEVAVRSGADGVHLGQRDELEGARERLGPDRVLGISVRTPAQARAAERAGADYLGVTVWATPTKPEAMPVGIEGLRDVVAATRLPVVGIGGITAANARRVLDAGAEGVAVVSAVGAAPDPVAATRELVAAVTTSVSERRER
ncbi:MAG TPA: thiamine phosphate synthase [Actinomycetota bacterium]|nr:thiamine phosphate synthase [Actinomycetota bacterium]